MIGILIIVILILIFKDLELSIFKFTELIKNQIRKFDFNSKMFLLFLYLYESLKWFFFNNIYSISLNNMRIPDKEIKFTLFNLFLSF